MKKAPLETLPDFKELSKRVFDKKGFQVLIGGLELSKESRDLFREQAKYIDKSELWETIHASLANEAIDLALIQSKDFDAVQFAKALWHLSTFMRNVVLQLSKE